MRIVSLLILVVILMGCGGSGGGDRERQGQPFYVSDWLNASNPLPGDKWWLLQPGDWQVSNGRLECLANIPDREASLAFFRDSMFGIDPMQYEISFQIGMMNPPPTSTDKMEGGILISGDHPGSFIRNGLFAGLDADGKLFFRNWRNDRYFDRSLITRKVPDALRLKLTVMAELQGYTLTLYQYSERKDEAIDSLQIKNISADLLTGRIALVSRPGTSHIGTSWWFGELQIDEIPGQARDDT